jgi:hypothetical protein
MRKETDENSTRIINVNKNKDIDVTELVLLSGYAGLVVMWVFACCA